MGVTSRRRWVAAALALAPMAVAAGGAPAAADGAPVTEFVVTVAPGTPVAAVGGTPIGPRDALVALGPGDAARLAAHPGVLAVEPDEPAAAAGTPPADGDQDALRRIGAETAWDVVAAAPEVDVAVIDAGVDLTHPDLAGRVVAVPPGPAGCAPLDPVLGTADLTPSGHGTRVAGIIAAAADGRGVAGVAWGGVRVRSYKVLGADLRGSTAAVAAAVHCAIDDGAEVINLSLVAGDTVAMRNALDRAEAAGVVVVAAAGNGGNGAHPGPYPAAHPTVVAVTAVTGRPGDERRAAFANGGPWVDLAAPGTGIVSTVPGAGWSVGDGTSYAVPFVSGAAALVLARDPGLAPAGVRARLAQTAEPLIDPTTGWGLVDLSAAVRAPSASTPACPAGAGGAGWVVDAYGGLHSFGGAPAVATGAYWSGWDIVRDLASVATRPGGYVLDGFGGLHPFGGAPPVSSPAYRPGWDVARGADRRADGSVVVVDAQGGLHVAGGGPAIGPGGPWWPGEDVARDVAADPRDPAIAYVLDAFGGVHVAGAGVPAPRVQAAWYAPARDLARAIVVLPEGRRGYVVDAGGRLHPWAVEGTALPPALAASTAATGPGRAAAASPSGSVTVVTGTGAVLATAAPPCVPAAAWPGRDLARGVALLPPSGVSG